MKQILEKRKAEKDFLKHKILSNIGKYIEDINDSKNVGMDIDVQDTNNITSYSTHFKCFIKQKSKDSTIRTKYFFAKHADIEEYNNLSKIQKLYRNAEIKPKIPELLDYFKERELLLMEGIKGENFLLCILKKMLPGFIFFNRNDLENKIKLCASWLAEFHNITHIKDSSNLDDEIELALSRLNYVPEFKAKRNILKEFLIKTKDEIGCTPISLTHRDFSARNIIFAGEGEITVVDWAQVLSKNIYYSIAYFITNLESRKRHFVYSFAPIGRLESLFLKEYKKKTRLGYKISTYKTIKKLYYIEYLYEYYTRTGVFEEWKKTNRSMHNFIKYVANKLLREVNLK